MKKSHQKIEPLIRQAIQACGEEFALSETRSLLYRALNRVSLLAEKRTRRNAHQERFAEEALAKRENWLKQIAENAKKMAELEAEQPKKQQSE